MTAGPDRSRDTVRGGLDVTRPGVRVLKLCAIAFGTILALRGIQALFGRDTWHFDWVDAQAAIVFVATLAFLTYLDYRNAAR